jgi:hypothetical protein
MVSFAAALVILASLSASANSAWTKETFKNGIYFGDSYTDTGRGMGSHPAGWVEPEVSYFDLVSLASRDSDTVIR